VLHLILFISKIAGPNTQTKFSGFDLASFLKILLSFSGVDSIGLHDNRIIKNVKKSYWVLIILGLSLTNKF
jgi:hypothetical protein